MSDFIGKNSVNKFYISIYNCHTVNEIKMKVSGLYSSLFYNIFKNFRKKIGYGKENRKEPTNFTRISLWHKFAVVLIAVEIHGFPSLTEFNDSNCLPCSPHIQGQFEVRMCKWYAGNGDDGSCEMNESFNNSESCDFAPLEKPCQIFGWYFGIKFGVQTKRFCISGTLRFF